MTIARVKPKSGLQTGARAMRIRGTVAEDKSRSFVIEELELHEPRYHVVSVMLVDASDFDAARTAQRPTCPEIVYAL